LLRVEQGMSRGRAVFRCSFQPAELSEQQFQDVSRTVHRLCGIHLSRKKKALVQARLAKRIRKLGIAGFDEYFDLIHSRQGARELGCMVDALTTNKTSFFREAAHFDFLTEKILPALEKTRIRFWSAACSSGQEPVSMAIATREHLPGINNRDVRILATDISVQMLAKARQGRYPACEMDGLPPAIRRRYFRPVAGQEDAQQIFSVRPEIRAMIHYAQLNLMHPWPMQGPFDVIFCRNVMIYFKRETQQQLIDRFWDYLVPGGYLFVGHSEGLSGISHQFRYICPATYRK